MHYLFPVKCLQCALWLDHEPLLSMSSKEAPLTLALEIEAPLKECALNISVFIPDFLKPSLPSLKLLMIVLVHEVFFKLTAIALPY